MAGPNFSAGYHGLHETNSNIALNYLTALPKYGRLTPEEKPGILKAFTELQNGIKKNDIDPARVTQCLNELKNYVKAQPESDFHTELLQQVKLTLEYQRAKSGGLPGELYESGAYHEEALISGLDFVKNHNINVTSQQFVREYCENQLKGFRAPGVEPYLLRKSSSYGTIGDHTVFVISYVNQHYLFTYNAKTKTWHHASTEKPLDENKFTVIRQKGSEKFGVSKQGYGSLQEYIESIDTPKTLVPVPPPPNNDMEGYCIATYLNKQK